MNQASSAANSPVSSLEEDNQKGEKQFSQMNNKAIENKGMHYNNSSMYDLSDDPIADRFIAAVEEGNQHLKEMNEILDKQGDAFLQLMSRLVNAMENQVAEETST